MEIKALIFALISGPSGAEGVFLNQNLPIRSASVLRDFNAYFLGTLSYRLFDFVDEPRDRLRVVKFNDDLLKGVRTRAHPTGGARAGASVTWAEVNDAAKPYGLRLPPDPSSGAFATSGGMVATNAAGPRTVQYGSVRSWVEALEVVEAEGTVRTVRRGMGNGKEFALTADSRRLIADRFPKTRKNASGYALDRFAESGDEIDLLVGSEGTLAIVTAVHWRLDPIPPDVAGAALGFADLESMTEAVPYLVSLKPSALELLDESLLQFVPDAPKVACLLLVEFERESAAAARGVVGDAVRGLKQSVSHVETAVTRAGLEKLWSVRREASPALARLPATQRSLQLIEDGCVPLDALGAYVAGLRAAADRRGIPVAIFGHAGDGHIHVNTLPDTTRDGWREARKMSPWGGFRGGSTKRSRPLPSCGRAKSWATPRCARR